MSGPVSYPYIISRYNERPLLAPYVRSVLLVSIKTLHADSQKAIVVDQYSWI